MLCRRCLALWRQRSGRLSRAVSRMLSILLARHRSWRLFKCQQNIWNPRRMGGRLELALRSVLAEHSERPIYFVLPALRISSSGGIDSSSGVSREIQQMKVRQGVETTHWGLSGGDSKGQE